MHSAGNDDESPEDQIMRKERKSEENPEDEIPDSRNCDSDCGLR